MYPKYVMLQSYPTILCDAAELSKHTLHAMDVCIGPDSLGKANK